MIFVFTVAVCEAGWPIISRGGPDSAGWTMVSPDIPHCSGQVTEWTYQGRRSRAFRAIIFRPVPDTDTQFQIVGINDIPEGPSNTPIVYRVPVADRITVQEGDVIGWSHGDGVLTYNTRGTYNVRWLGGNLHDGLETDQILDINTGVQEREYSIAATVESFEGTSTSK